MFTFIDNGEPGRTDMASIQIRDAGGALVLDVPLSNLNRGNFRPTTTSRTVATETELMA